MVYFDISSLPFMSYSRVLPLLWYKFGQISIHHLIGSLLILTRELSTFISVVTIKKRCLCYFKLLFSCLLLYFFFFWGGGCFMEIHFLCICLSFCLRNLEFISCFCPKKLFLNLKMTILSTSCQKPLSILMKEKKKSRKLLLPSYYFHFSFKRKKYVGY